MTNENFLLQLKFPNRSNGAGPATRSGDFAEILVADYLTFLEGYDVPRTRYDRKTITNESTKGSDVIAFKKAEGDNSANDELLVYEVKAKLVGGGAQVNRLQDAIEDSQKDELRLAESLSALKQRLYDKGDIERVRMAGRFQSYADKPYRRLFGAAAVLSHEAYNSQKLSEASTEEHDAGAALKLLVIVGEQVMDLVHALYGRAANEA